MRVGAAKVLCIGIYDSIEKWRQKIMGVTVIFKFIVKLYTLQLKINIKIED